MNYQPFIELYIETPSKSFGDLWLLIWLSHEIVRSFVKDSRWASPCNVFAIRGHE